jgi:glutaredoxin
MDQVPKKIVVYSSPGCSACSQVKGYLSRKNLRFEERDISRDESAARELEDLGLLAIPVTVIGGSTPIVGADLKKIDEALGK